MAEDRTEFSVKRSEVLRMDVTSEAATLLRELAEPRPVGDSIKSAITRVARTLGWSPGRTEDVWRREAKAIRAEEWIALQKAREAHARSEYARLRTRLASLEATLLAVDPDFHSSEIARLRALHGGPGRHDSSLD